MFKFLGAWADKLILGIPFYGQSYTMKRKSQNEPGDRCIGPGDAGPFTCQEGFLSYNEILDQDWEVRELTSAYVTWDDQWVGFDSKRVVQSKMEFVKSKNLGGAMAWSIDTDYNNELLRVMNDGLQSS